MKERNPKQSFKHFHWAFGTQSGIWTQTVKSLSTHNKSGDIKTEIPPVKLVNVNDGDMINICQHIIS